MWQQTHIFTGMNIAERQFGVLPEDSVIMEIGTNNNPWFTSRLLKKYPKIVAYTFRTIHSRNGNHIDARRGNAPIVWVPEREQMLDGVIQSSNAISIHSDIQELNSDDPKLQILQRRLQEIYNTIRWRIEDRLSWDRSVTLDNGVEQYRLSFYERLDEDFAGFPRSR